MSKNMYHNVEAEAVTCSTTDCCADECPSVTNYIWSEKCPTGPAWRPPVPCKKKKQSLPEIYDLYKDAVVRVSTQTGLVSVATPPGSLVNNVGPTGQPALTRYVAAPTGLPLTGAPAAVSATVIDQYYTHGNGFFIDNHAIVVPAHLVFLPPNATEHYSRYWNGVISEYQSGVSPNGETVLKVGRILVDVFNVNGSGHAFTYEAELIGADLANDIAILAVSCSAVWNRCLPRIKKCHPYLRFGNSDVYRNGEKIVLFGDLVSRVNTAAVIQGGSEGGLMGAYLRGYTEGTVYNYKFIDPVGLAQMEMVIVNANVSSTASGAPIIDKYGRVIAIQTLATSEITGFVFNTSQYGVNADGVQVNYPSGGRPEGFKPQGDGLVGGPAQSSFIRSIIKILNANCGKNMVDVYNVTAVPSQPGQPVTPFIYDNILAASGQKSSYFLVRHPYLGVAWELFAGIDYVAFSDQLWGTAQGQYNSDGSMTNGPQRQNCFSTSGSGKDVVGILVRGLAGQAANYLYLPGGTGASLAAANFQTSPLIAAGVNARDVIYGLDKLRLGGLDMQGHPTLALWCLNIGSKVDLNVKVFQDTVTVNGSSQINPIGSTYSTIKTVQVTTAAMPSYVAFPWYKYHDLPLAAVFEGSLESQSFFTSPLPEYTASRTPFFPML
jgi:S1-C subfamily serine protease